MPIFARILDEKYIKTFFMINPIVKTIELPDGRTITLETGKLAKQADGANAAALYGSRAQSGAIIRKC